MAGLVPAIHAAPPEENFRGYARHLGVDGLNKSGDDVGAAG